VTLSLAGAIFEIKGNSKDLSEELLSHPRGEICAVYAIIRVQLNTTAPQHCHAKADMVLYVDGSAAAAGSTLIWV
jgi:hypothetical protein